MSHMIAIEIPREVLHAARMTPRERWQELAIHLFQQGKLSFGKAREDRVGIPTAPGKQGDPCALRCRRLRGRPDDAEGSRPAMSIVSNASPLINLARIGRRAHRSQAQGVDQRSQVSHWMRYAVWLASV